MSLEGTRPKAGGSGAPGGGRPRAVPRVRPPAGPNTRFGLSAAAPGELCEPSVSLRMLGEIAGKRSAASVHFMQ